MLQSAERGEQRAVARGQSAAASGQSIINLKS